MPPATETIAAIATGAGRGGVGIVRVSGPLAHRIGTSLTGIELQARHAHKLNFLDAGGLALDTGIALRFDAPHSYTGEDVLELQGHGGSMVLDLVLTRVLALGARPARPGEFTERAFLNERIDLAQAEAVADLIDSGSHAAARAAMRSLHGEFSIDIKALQEQLIDLRVWLESALDFSEEEIDFLADPVLTERATAMAEGFARVQARATQGQRLRDGLVLVIAGSPNAGKSSLLNALARTDTAIVTEVAGTTRDVLHEHITLQGVPLHLVDTAGLRDTGDPVEREGVRRARAAVASADRVLWVVDAQALHQNGDPMTALHRLRTAAAWPEGVPVTLVLNKIDLLSGNEIEALRVALTWTGELQSLSVLTRAGLPELERHLLNCAGVDNRVEGVYLARRRHLDALQRAQTASLLALQRIREGVMPELAAEDMRAAQTALGEILGHFDSEDLLGEIFSRFCIGK